MSTHNEQTLLTRLEKFDEEEEHEHYDSFFQYVLSVLGFTVGYGGLWRFPYLVYDNGGGVFLIPYLICMIFFGMPLLYLEAAVGQMHQQTIPKIYTKINKGLKMAGYVVIFLAYGVAVQYNVLLAYSYRLIFTSFSDPLPFLNYKLTDNTYFNEVILDKSPTIEYFGQVNWQLAGLYIFSIFIIYECTKRGIKISSKILILTVIVPYVFLTMLAVRGWFLTGSYLGLQYLFRPDWSKLFGFKIWMDALVQVFYQLSISTAGLLNYSSKKRKNDQLQKILFIVPIGLVACGLLSGLIIFMYVGHYCYYRQVSIHYLSLSGVELAFNVIPKAIGILPWANILLFIFSLVLVLLGIDSMFGFVEATIDSLSDEFKDRDPILFGIYISRKRIKILTIIAFTIFFPVFCSSAGIYYLEYFDTFVTSIGLPLGALMEIYVFVHLFKFSELENEVYRSTGYKTPKFIKTILESRFIIFSLIGVCGIGLIRQFLLLIKYSWYHYLLGWVISLYSFIIAFVYWRKHANEPNNFVFEPLKGRDTQF